MFLDPEPRNTRKNKNHQTEFTGFIPPLTSQADQRIIRKPLLERSPNQTIPKVEDGELKPTVRLVRATPSVASIRKQIFGESEDNKAAAKEGLKPLHLDLKSGVPRIGFGVSDSPTPTNEDHDLDSFTDDSLQSAVSEDLPPWKRRSISSSNFSNATTLKGSESAGSAYARSERLSSGTTLRDLSTLHDNSLEDLLESAEEAGPLDDTDVSETSYDFEESTAEQQTIESVRPSLRSYESDLTQAETPKAKSSRPQTWTLIGSDPVDGSRISSGPSTPTRISSKRTLVESYLQSESSPVVSASPHEAEQSLDLDYAFCESFLDSTGHEDQDQSPVDAVYESSLDIAEETSEPEYDTSFDFAHETPNPGHIVYESSPDPSVSEEHTPAPDHIAYASTSNPAPFTSSPNFAAFASSPNFVAYDSSPARPRSRSHPLRGEVSYDSITSRLEDDPSARRRSLAPQASWSSIDPTSSLDTLPSLHVPRRRLRHMKASQSLDMNRRMQHPDTDDMFSQTDVLPYPRNAFSANLSTIASESDRSRSQTASYHLSQFSIGSGVMSQGESGILNSRDWSDHRLESVPVQAFTTTRQEPTADEPGDMTLGLYREESAMPEPLFRAPSPVYQSHNKRFNGPLPPLPPMPDAEEGHDTVTELTNPSLRLKRSGRSLRNQRSNNSLRHQRSFSTPLHSRQVSTVSCVDSDRWSTGSSIFPTWAKHYYSGNIALASMSQMSLYVMPSPPTRDGAQNGMRYERYPSQRYQRSITTPPLTASSRATTRTPQSRSVIPAIFRPRNRAQRLPSKAQTASPQSRDHQPRDVQPDVERDSMAIEPAPSAGVELESHLPSGHPKYGTLRDEPQSSTHAIPRKYSKQKRWNDMTFPRRMSKDRIAGYNTPIPHLAPTKRSSAHVSAWRPPSFVESIDVILKSRGHRQILFFFVGFICPLSWIVGAFTPLPPRPADLFDLEKGTGPDNESLGTVMQTHEAGEAAAKWQEERAWRQGVWWRNVNRVMSILGLFIIGAVIAIAVVATH